MGLARLGDSFAKILTQKGFKSNDERQFPGHFILDITSFYRPPFTTPGMNKDHGLAFITK
jgi:hypothetical protein